MSCEQETLRVLLQNKFDRIENLIQMNHAATLAVPSILAAIWGVSLNEKGFVMIPVLCIISIFLLWIWRYFAHYLDDDVAKNYVEIATIEERIGLFQDFPELTIFQNVLNSLNLSDTFKVTISERPATEKIQFFDLMYKEKKMGYRGHEKWDTIAFLLIFVFSILGIFFIVLPVMLSQSSQYGLGVSIVFAIISGYMGKWMLCFLFRKCADIQSNPNPADLPKIFTSIIRKNIK